jgi:hypothetical protein
MPLFPWNSPPAGLIQGEGGLVVLFCRVFLGDVFSVVNEIVVKLTGDADLVGVDFY